MSTEYIFLTGRAKWAKVQPHQLDKEYNRYGLSLYLDEGSMKKYKSSGIRLELKEDEEGQFIRPRRDVDKLFENQDRSPKVLRFVEGEYVPFEGLIGNGSLVNCKIAVYDSKKGKGHRLEAVAVENLVEYHDSSDQSDLPF